MFDFAWSEIALIGVVALVAIGPKDLPIAIKAVAAAVKKARRMASEFQVHVDEMVREANLHEVRDQFNDIRRMDIKGKILNAVDGDGTLRTSMAENPLQPATPPLTTPPPLPETVLPPMGEHVIATPGDLVPTPLPEPAAPVAAEVASPAPAMIPPADAKQPPLHA